MFINYFKVVPNKEGMTEDEWKQALEEAEDFYYASEFWEEEDGRSLNKITEEERRFINKEFWKVVPKSKLFQKITFHCETSTHIDILNIGVRKGIVNEDLLKMWNVRSKNKEKINSIKLRERLFHGKKSYANVINNQKVGVLGHFVKLNDGGMTNILKGDDGLNDEGLYIDIKTGLPMLARQPENREEFEELVNIDPRLLQLVDAKKIKRLDILPAGEDFSEYMKSLVNNSIKNIIEEQKNYKLDEQKTSNHQDETEEKAFVLDAEKSAKYFVNEYNHETIASVNSQKDNDSRGK